MTRTETETTGQLEKRRFYRRLIGACILVGVVAYIAAVQLGYVLLGTAVYWAAFLAMLGIWYGTSIELFDEREQMLDLEAGGLTLGVFAFVLILGAPGLAALESAGYYDAPRELWGAMYGYGALYLVYGAIYTVHRFRS